MATLTPQMKRYILPGILLAIVFLVMKGCEFFPESTFTLSSDSRLPKWITLPPGYTRADVSLTLSYYTLPYARFALQDKNQRTIEVKSGRMDCEHIFQLSPSPPDYPIYEVVTIDGITEIMEHRKMEPIFYVTDDAAVWKQYRAIGCKSPKFYK